MANDPYVLAGVVGPYELVGVFTPGTHAPELEEFLKPSGPSKAGRKPGWQRVAGGVGLRAWL